MTQHRYTPEFLAAVDRVLEHEGGYSDDPDDRGGETRFGISRRWHPNLDIARITRDEATAIYWREYWLAHHLDLLPPAIAAKVLDLAVLMSPRGAIMCLQDALRACGHYHIAADGVIGPQTLDALAHCDAANLLCAIRSEAAGAFRLIAERFPTNQKFLRGWLARAYA